MAHSAFSGHCATPDKPLHMLDTVVHMYTRNGYIHVDSCHCPVIQCNCLITVEIGGNSYIKFAEIEEISIHTGTVEEATSKRT